MDHLKLFMFFTLTLLNISFIYSQCPQTPKDLQRYYKPFVLNEQMTGKGSYSVVYEVQQVLDSSNLKENPKMVAKLVDLTQYRKFFNMEVSAYMTAGPHPNIMKMLGHEVKNEEKCGILILKKALGTFSDLLIGVIPGISMPEHVTEEQLFEGIFSDLSAALRHIHSKSIVHDDLYDDNVFVFPPSKKNPKRSFVFKLGDFNRACVMAISEKRGGDVNCDFKKDIRHFGAILLKFIGKFWIYFTPMVDESIEYSKDGLSPEFIQLIDGMINMNRGNRWDWTKIMNSAWVEKHKKESTS